MHLLIDTGVFRMVEETKQIGEFSSKGLRVLVVDADPLSLLTLERMLRQCHYNVTTCSRVVEAISLVMENNGCRFDIVITDVYLPDEDGFELLDVVGLTLDIPIILMSSDGETSVVMKAITHGACDYLIKPLTMEVLRNIWQHVFRRRGLRPTQPAPRYLRNDELNGEADDGRVVDSPVSHSKKRKVTTDNTAALQNNNFPSVDVGIIDDISSLKKSRVHWTAQLHEKFVRAVNQLEVDKAVPKRILEIMKVQGLTRENVASHLQKYRLYLKRLSGSIPEPYPIASFQAAEDGKSGGTMQICPSRRLKAVPPLSSSSLKGLSSRLEFGSREIDAATLKSLQQYRAYQQNLAANRSARVLGTAAAAIPSNVDVSKPTATLNRTSSLDHDSLWKSGRDAGDDQHGLRTNSLEGLADQSLKDAVKLQDLEADRCSPKKLPSARSMSSSSSQTLLSVQGSVADDDLTKRMEGISCIGTDYEEELFDNLVEECGLSEAQFHFMSAALLDHILE